VVLLIELIEIGGELGELDVLGLCVRGSLIFEALHVTLTIGEGVVQFVNELDKVTGSYFLGIVRIGDQQAES
jgi:hypothetical protein